MPLPEECPTKLPLSPFRKWLHGLLSAAITGLSTAFLSVLGINGAEAVGVKVTQLTAKQIIIVTACGGLVGMAAYLKQSPLPEE